MTTSITTLTDQMNSFDTCYRMSDDSNTYTKCNLELKSIQNQLSQLSNDELLKIKSQLKSYILEYIPFGKFFEGLTEPTTQSVTETETQTECTLSIDTVETHTEQKNGSFRSKVFRMAHSIYTTTGNSFAICLSKAWAMYRLGKKMLTEQVQFTYKKVDGSTRKAIGSLKEIGGKIKGTGKSNVNTFNYYDMEANGFRSFRIENLVSVS